MSDEIEVGRWYSYVGAGEFLRSRPVQVLGVEGQVVRSKLATGAEMLLARIDIGGQVEDAVPGKTEPCLVCSGREMVPDAEGGTKPCPNCRGLH